MLDFHTEHSDVCFYPPFALQKRGKVLIADDQPDLRLLYKRVLGLEGWEVIEAFNGREVLQLVIEESPDVIVLDNKMPEMSGEEVVKNLRALDFDIPTVLITSAQEVKGVADRLGLEFYLGKPFKPKELKNAVQFACGARSTSHF